MMFTDIIGEIVWPKPDSKMETAIFLGSDILSGASVQIPATEAEPNQWQID